MIASVVIIAQLNNSHEIQKEQKIACQHRTNKKEK